MAEWVLKQLDRVVDSFLASCDPEMQGSVSARLVLLSEKGSELRGPFTDKLINGLFELRAISKRKHARLIFFYEPQKTIVFVHALIKSSWKIPGRDIDTAIQRKNRIKSGAGTLNAIDYIN
jgi:phage-related protein